MIKAALIRYKVFILLVFINIIMVFAMPEIGIDAINITKKNLLEMMSVIPPIFIMLGLLDVGSTGQL
jgi:hypothetical protein